MIKNKKISLELEYIKPLNIGGKTSVRYRLEIPKKLAQELDLKTKERAELWVDRKGRRLVYEV